MLSTEIYRKNTKLMQKPVDISNNDAIVYTLTATKVANKHGGVDETCILMYTTQRR